jgi:transcriptional regulator with XRE-family HTH domain
VKVGKKYQELLKLKGKMVEEKETIESLAEKTGMDRNTLSNKIRGNTAFDILEIRKVSEELNIDPDEVVDYFFTDWSHNAK